MTKPGESKDHNKPPVLSVHSLDAWTSAGLTVPQLKALRVALVFHDSI